MDEKLDGSRTVRVSINLMGTSRIVAWIAESVSNVILEVEALQGAFFRELQNELKFMTRHETPGWVTLTAGRC